MTDQDSATTPTPATADPETIKKRETEDTILEIKRGVDGQTVQIYIKSPRLAEVVRKMANGNAPIDEYHEIYKPILVPIPEHKTRIFTKPAVGRITANFTQDPGFDWNTPRGVLLYNADALEKGYTLTYKVDKPFATDQARRWAKMFTDGCHDILANARAFTITWVMREKNPIQEAERRPEGTGEQF